MKKVGRVIDLSASKKAKTILDSLNILLVEDKAGIVATIEKGLEHLPWEITKADTAFEGFERFLDHGNFDLVLMSLSLPEDTAFDVFKKMKAQNPKVPIIGMVVKTDTERQHKALQLGFEATISKPIDVNELELRACRTMGVDTSPRYFKFTEERLHILIPQTSTSAKVGELLSYLRGKVTEAVDSGCTSVVMDTSACSELDISLIKFFLEAQDACRELSMSCYFVGGPEVIKSCEAYEESRNWKFYPSVDAIPSGS